MGNKRKNESDIGGGGRTKKAKSNTGAARNTKEKETPQATSRAPDASANQPGPSSQKLDAKSNPNRRPRIRKLAPPRPFPTVASASSATGPRSAHHEGKNNICITRKTKLAAYLRRCKALLVDDGYKELKLSAMGAAIPHLALLAVSLPPILPWAEDEVHVDVFTGSAEVHDEMLSESGSEAEDGPREEFRTRVKSTMNIIVHIGQGETSTTTDSGPAPPAAKKVERQANGGKGGIRQEGVPAQIVLQELEQDGMEAS